MPQARRRFRTWPGAGCDLSAVSGSIHRVRRARVTAPLPSVDQRSLLAYAGYHAPAWLLDRLDPAVVSGIAKPLVHAALDQAFVDRAASLGLLTALPGEAWRNQLAPDDPRRVALKGLGYMLDARTDPSENELSDSVVADYAAKFVDAQISRGATLVGTPAHVHLIEGANGRENDLRLAEAAVAEWEARQGGRLRPDGRPTGLFATIAVQGSALGNADLVTRLVRQYLGLRVDGFWIAVFNCTQGLAQLGGATRLGMGLQSDGRFAVLSGVGNAHAAALARGLAATCAGHHGMAPTYPPAALPTDEDHDLGIGVHIYHPAILGCTALGEEWDPARRALFRTRPCNCDHHPAGDVPEGRAKREHNLQTLQDEARAAIAIAPVDAADVFARRAKDARALRALLELGGLKPGWRGAASAAAWNDDARAAETA